MDSTNSAEESMDQYTLELLEELFGAPDQSVSEAPISASKIDQ